MNPCTVTILLIIIQRLEAALQQSEEARLHALRELDTATRASLRARRNASPYGHLVSVMSEAYVSQCDCEIETLCT